MSLALLQTAKPVEVYLLSGEFHFADESTIITTVLGSCISITVWHPRLRIGGMSHSVLPSRGKPGRHQPDGYYADEAIQLILHEIGKNNTRPAEYQVKLFGGGNMFQQFLTGNDLSIARENIGAARALLEVNGFIIHAEHVGGNGHRRIIFDLYDGSVLVKHQKL